MSIQLHNSRNLLLLNRFLINKTFSLCRNIRLISSTEPEAIFMQRNIEVPIVTVTEENNVDIIGPPDPVSNLRPIIRKKLLNETVLQQKLRLLQDQTHEWNQKFWAEHNTQFLKEKNEYILSRLRQNEQTLSADEMSEFYKTFLDKNWSKHVNYNIQWYKRNLTILLLSLGVSVNDILRST